MNKAAYFIVLAEDWRHQQLVRRYLVRRFQCSRYDIHPIDLPSGRSAGEQWVRENYPRQLEAWRNRSAHARTALIVVIDADTNTVANRQQQLRRSAQEAGVAARGDDDAVVHLIPKRNVETWILCLTGETVNESGDYKHAPADFNSLFKRSADTLYDWSRPNAQIPAGCVPSLRDGMVELQRLEDDRGFRRDHD